MTVANIYGDTRSKSVEVVSVLHIITDDRLVVFFDIDDTLYSSTLGILKADDVRVQGRVCHQPGGRV